MLPLYSSLQPIPPVLHPREVLALPGGEGSHVCLLQVEDGHFVGKEGDSEGGGDHDLWHLLCTQSTVEPIYCGHLGDLMKCPHFRNPSIVDTLWTCPV